MSTEPPVAAESAARRLVADVDRERVVELLRECCADGRLTFGELADRAGAAYTARTGGELAAVLEGLPAATAPEPAIAGTGGGAARRAVHLTVSLMSGVSRRGRWRVAPHSVVVAVMGGCCLDLRSATIEGTEVVIDVLALMGCVDVIVPEGVDVDLQGLAIMGGKESRIAPVPVRPGTPLVRVRGLAVMGGVVVRSRPAAPPSDAPEPGTPWPAGGVPPAAWRMARHQQRIEARLQRRLARWPGYPPGWESRDRDPGDEP